MFGKILNWICGTTPEKLYVIVRPEFGVITEENWHDASVHKLDLIYRYQFSGNQEAINEVGRLNIELDKITYVRRIKRRESGGYI